MKQRHHKRIHPGRRIVSNVNSNRIIT
ncbi:hypothetical protein YM29_00610 [Salmonella enterica subsp. enterica serovar Typhimurium]|nr:hypothetical protein [Salmonella enterica subsp. enterica serovar Weltevreden]EBR8863819.1 hypothetical protein [Salmonella enterica subsp. enterica serovar Thompson]EBS5527852.1 hypothetical protein [Salmonella enterica subsp. enterica serovar Telelkebir]EBU9744731.1 hypothetical protein [Salmonella enterica subsp. enterica serovar Kentucky]EBV0299458.1 hypothetical protein [Salmonella enterica subsp. enterica serovar Enteritidis]EBY9123206.1 hypothetical protein [Salmonella enterica subsp